eukprot:1413290-Amphidinium_carterae.1
MFWSEVPSPQKAARLKTNWQNKLAQRTPKTRHYGMTPHISLNNSEIANTRVPKVHNMVHLLSCNLRLSLSFSWQEWQF